VAITGRNRKVKLTINNIYVPELLSDFPVVITRAVLPDEVVSPTDVNRAQVDFGDVLFSTDSAGLTQIPCEIVSWGYDSSHGLGDAKIEIHVKVTSVSPSLPDTDIWMWYNTAGTDSQPAVTDLNGRNAVWSNNYLFVHHLQQDPSGGIGAMIDSTGNLYDGTANGSMNSGNLVNGPFGGYGLSFDGIDDNIDCGSLNVSGYTQLTIESWVKSDCSGTAEHTFFSNHSTNNAGIICRIDPANLNWIETYMVQEANTNKGVDFQDLNVTANNWCYIEISVRGGNIEGSLDGTQSSYTTAFSGMDANPSSNNLELGDSPHTSSDPLTGEMDEVRFSSVSRSFGWVTACYNNQSSPSTFIVAGTPESTSGGSSVSNTTQSAFNINQSLTYSVAMTYEAKGNSFNSSIVNTEMQQKTNKEQLSQLEINKNESLQGNSKFASLANVLQSHNSSTEAGQHITKQFLSGVEALFLLLNNGDSQVEIIQGTGNGTGSTLEVIQSINLEYVAQVESMKNLYRLSLSEYESTLLTNRSFNVYIEALSAINVSQLSQMECKSTLLSVANSLVSVFESLSNESQTQTVLLESRTSAVTVSNSGQVNTEILQRLAKFELGGYVVLRGFNKTSTGQLECVSTVIVSGLAANEMVEAINRSQTTNTEIMQYLHSLSAGNYEVSGSGFLMRYEHLLMLLNDTEFLH